MSGAIECTNPAGTCPGTSPCVTSSRSSAVLMEQAAKAIVTYIEAALREVESSPADSVNVRSYLYWSLLDNFEWSPGYRPKFGLVGVDRHTFARVPKPGAYWWAPSLVRPTYPAHADPIRARPPGDRYSGRPGN